MSSNYIIELNQNDPRSSVKANGDYSVNITEKTILNEGDSILLNKVFIDTVAKAQGKIKIENPTELTINFSKWVWNYDADKIDNFLKFGGQPVAPAAGPMMSPALVCEQNTNPVAVVDEIILTPRGYGDPVGNNTTLTYTYTDPNDNQRTGHAFLAERDVYLGQPRYDITPFFVKQGTTPVIQNEGAVKSAANAILLQFNVDNTGADMYIPKNYSQSFTLPAGNYLPEELGSLISDGFTTAFRNNQDFAFRLEDNLVNLNNSLFSALDNGDKLIAPRGYYGAFNGPNELTYGQCNTDNAIMAGTNQFAFEWLSDFNKFAFNTIHAPLTDDKGNPSFRVYKGVSNYTVASAYSGILFNSLEPISFWQDKLGFVLTDLTGWNKGNYTLADFDIMDWAWQPGTYETTGQILLSGLSGLGDNLPKVENFDDLIASNTFVNIEDTNQIVARNQILNAAGSPDTAYFLVEINSKFSNTFINSTQNFRNIQAIISTYYSTAASTIGTNADAIVYTHKGAPVELSGFDVRILDEKKEVASDIIDDNNVVFLQVIRAPPQQVPRPLAIKDKGE